MCDFPSWIEKENGEAVFLIDKDAKALMRKHGGQMKDYVGHQPLRELLGAKGRECEKVSIHPDVALAIMGGKMKVLAKAGGYDGVVLAGTKKVTEGRWLVSGWAKVTAHDNAKVDAHDNAEVTAYGNAEVYAYGNAKVDAYGNATLTDYRKAV